MINEELQIKAERSLLRAILETAEVDCYSPDMWMLKTSVIKCPIFPNHWIEPLVKEFKEFNQEKYEQEIQQLCNDYKTSEIIRKKDGFKIINPE